MENKTFIKVFLLMIAVMFTFSFGMYLIQNGLRASYVAIPLVSTYFVWVIYVIVKNKL